MSGCPFPGRGSVCSACGGFLAGPGPLVGRGSDLPSAGEAGRLGEGRGRQSCCVIGLPGAAACAARPGPAPLPGGEGARPAPVRPSRGRF